MFWLISFSVQFTTAEPQGLLDVTGLAFLCHMSRNTYTKYLSFIISIDSISIDLLKVEVVKN